MTDKLERLGTLLGGLENALIAYSGGVDSVFLAKVAFDRLGKRVKAVTAISPSYPTYELEETQRLAREIGIEHEILRTEELDRPEYRANRGDRCYFCKTELYETMASKAREWGYRWLLNGVNVDDLGDYRPGLKAADENGVRSPLVEAGLTKAEIRELSKSLGLSTWNKPALACLSSRFPPGTEVTEERLGRIDRIESALVGMGFRTVRVRFHEPIARIEVGSEEFERFLDPDTRSRVDRLCRENGFLYSALDLAGYKMGSVNQVLFQIT
ncbi:MAG TPA: ATP-dependent sacrificial sulfur transferase LarE [bacterium]|nr:ATP-dependent sacrificial sulfur transferase LarE [bacterium]